MDTNWASLIGDLQASGMTYAAIAGKADCAGSTIGDLAKGRTKEPRGKTAIKLLALHKRIRRKAA